MQNELYIVADAIKALRESRGLTQEQLADEYSDRNKHPFRKF